MIKKAKMTKKMMIIRKIQIKRITRKIKASKIYQFRVNSKVRKRRRRRRRNKFI